MTTLFNQVFKPVLERLPENNRLELIWKLAIIDFRKRYYDSLLGLFWALLNPLFRVAVYYFVFVQIIGRGGNRENFALFLFSAIIFWMFFMEGTKKSIKILQQKRYLIENIQFNKLDLFYSNTFSVFLGFLFNLGAYLFASVLMGIPFTSNIIFLPLFILNISMLILAIGLLLSTLFIYVKDLIHFWDMVTFVGFWMNPIFYTAEELAANAPILLYLIPTAGIIDNARKVVLMGVPPDMNLVLWDLFYAVVLLIIGLYIFTNYSHKAAEKL